MNAEQDIAHAIAISPDISGDMTRVATDYAYWSARYVELKFKCEEAELSFRMWLASKKQEVLEESLRAGGRKDMTEAAKEAAIMSKFKDAYAAMCTDILKLQRDMEILKNGINAIKMKSEMLISIGANFRQEREMTAGSTIRQRQ